MPRLRGQRWQADAWVDGKRVRPAFDTREEAEAFERDPKGEQVRPLVEPMFLHGAKVLWHGTKNELIANLITKELIRRLGPDTRISAITSARIQDLKIEMLDEGKSKMTVNRKMSGLSKLLKHCKTRGAIAVLPDIGFYPKQKGRIRFLSYKEEAAILDPLPLDHYHLSNFLLFTGCRMGEALDLEWQDVGTDRVTFWKNKGNKPRTIPLTGKAPAALAYMRGRDKGPFAGIIYRPYLESWHMARTAAGLKDDKQVIPHILRHTCASRLVQAGADIVRVKEWLGHSTIEQTMQYAHLAPASLFDIAPLLNKVRPDTEHGTGL